MPADHQRRHPVLLGGVSVGRRDAAAGTIAAIVIDKAENRPALLSSWHVLAGPAAVCGDEILQPGPGDGGRSPVDSVAALGRSMLDEDGDAAIAHLTGMRFWAPYIYGTFTTPESARDPELGEILVKSGRSTGQTRARVDGEGIYFLDYEVEPGMVRRRGINGFKLVPADPGIQDEHALSSAGDSGSSWCDGETGEAVGLHFAGENDPAPGVGHAIACKMTSVLARLNIRFACAADLAIRNMGAAEFEMSSSQGSLYWAARARPSHLPMSPAVHGQLGKPSAHIMSYGERK